MSDAPGLVRPAARSAAVRPHSASSSSPWPASAARPCAAPLFFASLAPALWHQSYWLAELCRGSGRGGVVTVTPLVTPLVTPKPLQSLDIPEPLPRYHSPPAHVIRSRARACASPPLSLVTWEQRIIVYVEQWLAAFPRPLPAALRVVTWEQAKRSAHVCDCLCAGSNKVEAGNGDLQLAGGDAGEKFRGAIARLAGVDQGDIARIQQLPTRRGGNGGFRPLSARSIGHVGRPMLEGCGQAAEKTGDLGARLKLGRLRRCALVELGGRQLEQLALGAIAAVSPEGTPGAPNPRLATAAVLALHAGPIWIEDRAQGRFLRGSYSNRRPDGRKNAQTSERLRGPGGATLIQAAKTARPVRVCEAGGRAGVNSPRLVARPHETVEFAKLRRVLGAVKTSAVAAVDKLDLAA